MKVDRYEVFSLNAMTNVNPKQFIFESLKKIDSNIAHLKELRPDLLEQYIVSQKKRFEKKVKDHSINASSLEEIIDLGNLPNIKENPDLFSLVVQLVCLHLNINESQLNDDEVAVSGYDYMMALRRIPYYSVKALTDFLKDEDARELWDAMISKQYNEHRINIERAREEMKKQGKTRPPLSDISTRQINAWTEIGLADFSRVFLDDNMVLYRFDSCLTHEVLKDLNDPDWAYLSSCYVTDHPMFNEIADPKMRRTQTLHHADFCDELYWNPEVHKDPEQPSIEFTRNLNHEKSE